VSAEADRPELLGPALLNRLPASVQGPGYDRAALRVGMAHIGVGAFHRCHQAEYTDDLLGRSFDRWGVVGINIRDPRLSETLGRQGGLYTRLCRADDRVEARVIGNILSVVDSQASPAPTLRVLASPAIDVITLTVTEKAYCHRPASGELDPTLPDVVHDLADPELPRSLPGVIVRALELRMRSHRRPVTLVSCDNIPANGMILAGVVRTMAERRGAGLADWIAANAAFPSTMVDRISPMTTPRDLEAVEGLGYRDRAAAACEPFRQWVIESRFAGRVPRWDLAGAVFVEDVTPFEQLKMRVLNAAQSTLAYLGVLAGQEHTCDAVSDPVLAGFVRRMLMRESVSTLPPVPGISPEAYVEQSLGRLRNRAIRHRCHQVATDGSRKLVQRLINPAAERLSRGESVRDLAVAIAAWMAYLVRASDRFGRDWAVEDPEAARVAAMADRVGHDVPALTAEILAIDSVFAPEVAARAELRGAIADALEGLLSGEPMAFVRRVLDAPGRAGSRMGTGTRT
jgi:fructuronate reductase